MKNELKEKDNTKIDVTCCDCGKKFKTTQSWFDDKSKDGKLPCRVCRTGITDNKKVEKNTEKIEVSCCSCDKKFNTTQGWFDARNKDGKLSCKKCRTRNS